MSTNEAAAAAPTVSVVIRNFNRGRRLLRAVQSVRRQRYVDYELIVVDDASSDDSLPPVLDLLAVEPRLRVIELARNRGAAGAANVGVAAAQGVYVAFLDSDDEWLPDFLTEHVKALQQDGRAVMTYGPVYEVWPEWSLSRLISCSNGGDQRRTMLRGGCVHSMSTTVTRRSAIIELDGFDESLTVSHDFDFYLRLALAMEQPLRYVSKPLVRYAISGDGVTARFADWTAEYHRTLERGYSHPLAAPHVQELPMVQKAVGLALEARRQTHIWVRRVRDASVSVIVRTRNRLALLQRALASVEAQDWPEFEVIVIDDGSSDGSHEWLAAIDREDFKYVRFDESRGRAHALNYGALVAEGSLLAFLDDDDEWQPDYLREQVRAHSVLQGTPIYSYSDYHECVPGRPDRLHHHQPAIASDDPLLRALYGVAPHSMSMFMVERALWRAVGGANQSLEVGEDYDLQLRLLALRPELKPTRGLPVQIERPLVRWHRTAEGCDRAAMLEQYREHAARVYDGFLATPAGKAFRLLRPELERHFWQQLVLHFGNSFPPAPSA
jgi:glycosyltransferase involved in cell wall biosynthesis